MVARHYTDDEMALIEETRRRLGFHVTPEDPEWPIPDQPPSEGTRFWDDTGIYVYRSGQWIPLHQDGLIFVVGPE